MKPNIRPQVANFSSGPCAKRPGWNLEVLKDAALGRSHRAKIGKEKLAKLIDKTRQCLAIPADWRIGIVPASDTGAVEMALWSLLGARGVDVFAWESFGAEWAEDITKQLKLKDVRSFIADYGDLPDLSQADNQRDIVFTWNGTTSGVRVPNADFISPEREGLTICDATSAVFAMDLPWEKLDVTTWSWQKVLGGEAAHGMIVLSPRAVERLKTYTPPWPMPKIFRLTNKGALIEGIFVGETINTPSMLAVEDCLDALDWALALGGKDALKARSNANLAAVETWVATSQWASFLAKDPATRSSTSICLAITDPWFVSQALPLQAEIAKSLASLVEKEAVAFDIASYRSAPPGLRIWGGATVETRDIAALLVWLDWAWASVKTLKAA
jgi:phosphoserine aminotransferase